MCPLSSLSRKASVCVLPSKDLHPTRTSALTWGSRQHGLTRGLAGTHARSTRVPWEPRPTAKQYLAPSAKNATSVHETKPWVLVPSSYIEKKTREGLILGFALSHSLTGFCFACLSFLSAPSTPCSISPRSKPKQKTSDGGAWPV